MRRRRRSVALLLEVLRGLVLDRGARRVRVQELPFLDVLLHAPEHGLSPLEIRNRERDLGQELDRGIQQGGPSHEMGIRGSELEHQPPAERVPDPVCSGDSERRRRLGEVLDVRRERPGRLPAGAAVPAEVERQDATRAPTLLRQSLIHARVAGHAVQAHERLTPRVAPFVDVQQHRLDPTRPGHPSQPLALLARNPGFRVTRPIPAAS